MGKGLSVALAWLTGRKAKTAQTAPQDARFRWMYERFREILAINDSMLQLISDVEERSSGRVPFALNPVVERIRRATLDVFVMVKNLNQIADGRYNRLYDALGRLNADIEAAMASEPGGTTGSLVVPLQDLRADSFRLAGVKMANLGEVKAVLGLPVPDGFVVTTVAFARLLAERELEDRVLRLAGVLEMYGSQSLDTACREVQAAILGESPPEELADAIVAAYDRIGGGRDALVAMRSSAVGEDGASSHAGQYFSELNVSRELLLDSYAQVVASTFKPAAVTYRFERGLPESEAAMAVGCLEMVPAAVSGIMFSRLFREPGDDRVAVSATAGLADGVTAGRENAEELVVEPDRPAATSSRLLSSEQLGRLAGLARTLEAHFGGPQDVEWAFDHGGTLFVLQTRPMVAPPPPPEVRLEVAPGQEPLLSGGRVACSGVGCGPVHPVRGDSDLDSFPSGGVLVARHSSPRFTKVMAHCAAIVTDVGSPTGHMAILSREFGVPTVVGLDGAVAMLEAGRVVTVDATSGRLFDGAVPLHAAAVPGAPLAGSAVVERLRKVSRLIAPLSLVDPSSRDFRPSSCRSLHDITRFVHEKVYEVMFGFGDAARRDLGQSLRLDSSLPITIQLFDVGGGLTEGAGTNGLVGPGEVRSVPMRAFLEGMTDPSIRWERPRPVSARGFLSVLGESMAGPPASAQGVGGASFAVLSEPYMNFSTKAGYHFSTVDTYCGRVENKNYVHLRFAGGGAAEERRIRRVRFIEKVMLHHGFSVQVRGDILTARLEKYGRDYIVAILVQLGRLTMCLRQLDMLMDSDGSPDTFAEAFIAGDMDRFY